MTLLLVGTDEYDGAASLDAAPVGLGRFLLGWMPCVMEARKGRWPWFCFIGRVQVGFDVP